jgi:hypothetical protein
MSCGSREELKIRFRSLVDELQLNLTEKNVPEMQRIAQDMLDAWYRLKEHEQDHGCGATMRSA